MKSKIVLVVTIAVLLYFFVTVILSFTFFQDYKFLEQEIKYGILQVAISDISSFFHYQTCCYVLKAILSYLTALGVNASKCETNLLTMNVGF